jgi:hypothetical protein
VNSPGWWRDMRPVAMNWANAGYASLVSIRQPHSSVPVGPCLPQVASSSHSCPDLSHPSRLRSGRIAAPSDHQSRYGSLTFVSAILHCLFALIHHRGHEL